MCGEIPLDPLLDLVDQDLENNLPIEEDSKDEGQITTIRTTNECTIFQDDLAM